MRCYYCGGDANDADDHMPPEVLYNGAYHSYKKPDILKFPSCTKHNYELSYDDNDFAHLIVKMANPGNHASSDVKMHLLVNIQKIVWEDLVETDRRLALWNTKILRKDNDYDGNGEPKGTMFDQKYFNALIQLSIDRFEFLKRYMRRIVAGMHYHASNGDILGEGKINTIEVMWPALQRIATNGAFYNDKVNVSELYEKAFNKMHSVVETIIESGNSEVFQCTHACIPGQNSRGVVQIKFYGHLDCICAW